MDRNRSFGISGVDTVSSLSARRAWIEMVELYDASDNFTVALRKESVDRNVDLIYTPTKDEVALRKESVDRNDQRLYHCGEK